MDPNKSKTFWERPEGKTGLITLIAMLAGGAYGFSLILPWLIAFVTDLLHFAILGGAALALFVVASDARFRTLVSYSYKLIMRALTGAIVTIDPIGILNEHIDSLKERLAEMDKSIRNLNGQKKRLEAIIQENEDGIRENLGRAGAAQKQGAGYKTAFVLSSRQAGRLQKSNVTLKTLHMTMESLLARLRKMREASGFLVDDMSAEVKEAERKQAAIKAAYSAFSSAKRVLAGGADKALYDQAMESLANDYSMKIGEIEEFMEASDGFIKGIDLDNMSYEADAMKKLEDWDSRIDNLLDPHTARIATTKARFADPATDEALAEAEASEPVIKDRDSFADLFNNKQ